MTDPAEFDDIVDYGCCRLSEKALAEMNKLSVRYGLEFYYNAGGGEFRVARPALSEWRCQISNEDDVADLRKLREAVKTLEVNP